MTIDDELFDNLEVTEPPVPDIWDVIRGNDVNAVEYFLKTGFDVNSQPDFNSGGSVLHYACYYGHYSSDIVKLLLEKGADINAKDNYGQTPLHIAGYRAKSKHIPLLIEYGADVNASDYYGRTPLHHACEIADGETRIKCIYLLIKYGADVNAREAPVDNGLTPLQYVSKHNFRYTRLLLNAGAIPDALCLNIARELGNQKTINLISMALAEREATALEAFVHQPTSRPRARL